MTSMGIGERVGYRRSAATIDADELPTRAAALLDAGFHVALIAGHDDQTRLRAVYVFTAANPDRRVELHVPLERSRPHLPSLAALSFPIGRFEREMHDMFGIVPTNHPLPRRLVRHFHWPRCWYPMLHDAGNPPTFAAPDGPYPFRTVEGPGVYEIPVGPVHAGIIEPGHFRFSVVGETILNLKARLWFVHRGIEKLFQTRRAERAIELAERISGDTSVGHTLAFCHAVEDARGLTLDHDTHRLRAILLELERLYNHVTDLGALCNDVGHPILNNHTQRIREQLLRLNEQTTGHRLLRGAITPGAARLRQLPDPALLRTIAEDIAEVTSLALSHSVVLDRFTGTAVLTTQQASDLGVLGYVARASGLTPDARTDHPTLTPAPPRTRHTHTDGDVLSRFIVRGEEATASTETIITLTEQLDERTSTPAPITPTRQPTHAGLGLVEGWRGTIVHRIELAPDATLSRVKIVDPSFLNWPALPAALTDTIVPDFPLVNKSFNLSYAGNDL